jgi:RES domain-containing protein
MKRSLVERVAGVGSVDVSGTFYRHAAPGREAFAGGTLGRWGRAFPVIYLGRPPLSVTVEAYRHLVDPFGLPASAVQPRVLYTTTVHAKLILDLTAPENREAVGLTDGQLHTDIDDYDACQQVGRAAHQLELHGILVPAATGLGQTLALFAQRVSAAERPVVVESTIWQHLPADPRIARVVRDAKDGA